MSIAWAYIYNAPGSDPVADRFVLEKNGLKSVLVPVPNFEAAEQVAQDLIAEGIVSIELCGYFGMINAGKVIASVGGKVPVGAVTFGSESAGALAAAFGAGAEAAG